MKCRYCGSEISEGKLYCNKCGREVIIVPEYNPLDDMLAEQVKVGVNNEEDLNSDYLYDFSEEVKSATSPRKQRAGSAQKTSGRRMSTGRTSDGRTVSEREKKRRQAEARKAALRKKRRNLLLVIAVVFAVIVAGCVFLYLNSYNGVVSRGYKAMEQKEYGQAESYFKRALEKNDKKAEAYTGLSKLYIQEDKVDEMDSLFADTIEKQPQNADIYESYIGFYVDSKQPMKIPVLLDDAEDSVRETLADYIVEEPEFDLSDEEIFEDVQQIEITASSGTVYYTADGSDPTTDSTRYDGPVQIKEGENIIKAIAVDKRGIPSMPVEKHYVVEFPMEDAPVVSPSTGQYESAQTIKVKVPEGYKAYYTTDGSDPTESSTLYTEPIDMPDGDTLFKVILVNGNGRTSGITTRNYMLEIEE